MGRRGENIHKRKDGRWEARVIIGPPVEGRTSYKYLFGHSYREAKTLKMAFLSNQRLLSGAAATASVTPHTTPPVLAEPGFLDQVEPLQIPAEPQPISFGDVAVQWLASKKLAVKESSFAFYSIIVDKHLLPKFQTIDIRNMNSDMIAEFLEDRKHRGRIKDGSPLSDKTLSEIKSILCRILRYAKSRHYINEMPEIQAVSVKKKPEKVLTKPEIRRIESQAKKEDTTFALGVLLDNCTGIRIGELCALKWSDFDWENGTISITKTVSRIKDVDGVSGAKTHVVIGTPKTECSIRTIPLPKNAVPYFQSRTGEASCYLLTGTEKCMEPRVCRDRFKRFLKRADVENCSFHTLRHTYATSCIEQGMDVKSLRDNLGHSNVNITLQRYVHPSLESRKAQVNRLRTFAD